ncbi:MAG: integrase core domain-containing protein [Nitritalea sp.]
MRLNLPKWLKSNRNAPKNWYRLNRNRWRSYSETHGTNRTVISSFNKTYRNEILDRYLFYDLEEVKALTANWINDYNENRLHDSLGDMSPR